MEVKSPLAFRTAVLNLLSFDCYKNQHYTLYTNKKKPHLGHLISYARDDYYDFSIADYTIPRDFSISFNNPDFLMRFGILHEGVTEFEIKNNPVKAFTPSSFFVVEKDLKGKQTWKKGQHLHGTELTIYHDYFRNIIEPHFPNMLNLDIFIKNYTYTYLPLEIIKIILQLQSLAYENALTSIYLESKVLECIAILVNEMSNPNKNAFINQMNYGNIKIGKDRIIKLTATDIHAIQKAHDIIETDYRDPPTIKTLSQMVFLSEQKLKAGFAKQYHMTIGEYTNHMKMTVAANLLSTTDISVEDIAFQVGYNYSGNFSKMFKKTYGKTPLKFRKTK